MSDLPDTVYHSSSVSGLATIEPRIGTHGQPWVYATIDIAISAIFLSHEGRDLSCASGLSNGEVYLYERWPGAFMKRYSGQSGSIYELTGNQFMSGKTSFSGEVVSESPARVNREHRIEDAAAYLHELASQSRIQLFMHDDRPGWIPEDDSDLVDQVVRVMSAKPTARSMDYAREHLPHIVDRVEAKLASMQRTS